MKRPLYPVRDSTPRGWIYLLHFDPPYKHAQHYIGFTANPDERYERQLKGHGAKLVQAALAAGCAVTLALELPEKTLRDEVQLKNRGSAKRWCPVCKAGTSATTAPSPRVAR